MKTKFTALAAAWLTIAPAFLYAQATLSLKGSVRSADSKPLEGASVYLNRAGDSGLVKTALTLADGSFDLPNLHDGSYRLVISRVGYQTFRSDVILLVKDTVLPDITLEQKSAVLKEVAVTAQRPLIEHLIDRTVVNVDALIGNAGSTVMDVLEKSPGVIVGPNDAIQLRGKSSVKIYIDDKPTYLSGEDLANYLRSLPSSTIDRIELMPNPPARYDAAGNGGVINIRTKRIREKGFNGNLNLAYGQGKYARSNNSLNLNYRHAKLNVAANLGYTLSNNFNDVILNRYFDQSVTNISPDFGQTSFIRRQSHGYNARIGIDYYATEKTTFGILLTGLLTAGTVHTSSTSLLSDTQNQPDSTIIADNHDKRRFENGGINLNYRHAYDKKGRELTVDLDYLTYHTQLDQRFVNNSFYPDGTLYDSSLSTGDLPATIQIYSAKTDYTRPLAGGATLSAGLKTSYTRTDNIADYFNIVNQVAEPDYDKTNHFIYQENINAGYINAAGDVRRWSFQAGLRFENTIASGHQLGNAQKPDSSFNRGYNGLFPTFYVQYKLDSVGRQQLAFNYGRRLDRPYYADLNPFLSPLDKFTYNTGNPFLLPTYSNNFELSYTFKKITATLYYSYTKDKVDGLVQIINGYYYSQPGNLGNTYVKGIEIDAAFDPAKWFNLHLYGRVFAQRTVSDFYTGPLDTQGTEYFIRPILTFKPGRDWTMQIDGYYQSKLASEQFIDFEKKAVNTAVSKKLSGSVTVKLSVNDVFYTVSNNWAIGHLAGTQANYHSVNDSRNIVLFFTYRFGKAISDQRKHNANGAQSEQNRVKG